MRLWSPISLRDYSEWDTPRLRRAQVPTSVVATVAVAVLVTGCVGLTAWQDSAWHIILAVALVVAGVANAIVFGGALLRVRRELRNRRDPLHGA